MKHLFLHTSIEDTVMINNKQKMKKLKFLEAAVRIAANVARIAWFVIRSYDRLN